MRLVTWNVATSAGGDMTKFRERLTDMVEAITSLDGDVTVLTEYTPVCRHEEFVDLLKERGYSCLLSQRTLFPGKPKKQTNRILITAKDALTAGTMTPPSEYDKFPSNLLHVNTSGFDLIGFRFLSNSGAKSYEHSSECWDWLMGQAKTVCNTPFVIIGDFNIDMGNRRINRVNQARSELEELGWQFPALPDDKFSYRSKKDPTRKPSRIDHAMLTRHFIVHSADYVSESGGFALMGTQDSLSDHAALVVEADLK